MRLLSFDIVIPFHAWEQRKPGHSGRKSEGIRPQSSDGQPSSSHIPPRQLPRSRGEAASSKRRTSLETIETNGGLAVAVKLLLQNALRLTRALVCDLEVGGSIPLVSISSRTQTRTYNRESALRVRREPSGSLRCPGNDASTRSAVVSRTVSANVDGSVVITLLGCFRRGLLDVTTNVVVSERAVSEVRNDHFTVVCECFGKHCPQVIKAANGLTVDFDDNVVGPKLILLSGRAGRDALNVESVVQPNRLNKAADSERGSS